MELVSTTDIKIFVRSDAYQPKSTNLTIYKDFLHYVARLPFYSQPFHHSPLSKEYLKQYNLIVAAVSATVARSCQIVDVALFVLLYALSIFFIIFCLYFIAHLSIATECRTLKFI